MVEQDMTKHLTSDKVVVIDHGKKQTIKKHSEVTVISEHGEIIIVDFNGVRFPINRMYLK